MNKKRKLDEDYRRQQFAGENCGTCEYMQPDGHCEKVAGIVDRDHVCNLWARG